MRIKDPTWSGLADDTKKAWARETNKNKEMDVAQFVAESKSGTPVTKNQHLRTVYRMEFDNSDGDGCNFYFTVNSEGTFEFNANSAMFDTTADNNSNGEIIIEGSDLNVNATAATIQTKTT